MLYERFTTRAIEFLFLYFSTFTMSEQETFKNKIAVNTEFPAVKKVYNLLNAFFNVIPAFFHRREHQIAGCKFCPARIDADENLKDSAVWVLFCNTVQFINPKMLIMIQD
ncbi:MAG: hypothetical protein KatS3mg070_2681 [Meiothermus sp.]|nr:MAG: hypothetical protein KatS3mg070_2681 [Meiothermus sp.]GIW30495.1 MAG: hypothetical protein KatS3mg071_0669 [Meiothermus sp.]